MAICSRCKAQIVWINTVAGKKMPCDAAVRRYKLTPSGKDKIFTDKGELVSCEIDCAPEELTGVGYIPHWITCPYADDFRKRGKK